MKTHEKDAREPLLRIVKRDSMPIWKSMLVRLIAVVAGILVCAFLSVAVLDRSIGFVEFQELKYAIEALGGEYNEPRDFTADKDYLAIEAASSKAEVKS